MKVNDSMTKKLGNTIAEILRLLAALIAGIAGGSL